MSFGGSVNGSGSINTDSDVALSNPATGDALAYNSASAKWQNTAQPVINVKDHGATGDGTTDDTAAVQAAIQAASTAGGGTVAFTAGTYVCATLTLPSNVHLRGAGTDTTILQLRAATNADLVIGQNFASLTGTNGTGGIYSWSLSSLTLDGNSVNNTAGAGLRVYGYGFMLQDVTVRNCVEDGIYTEWSTSASSPGHDSMESFVVNVKSHDNGGNGVQWKGPHDSIFVNAIAYSNAAVGFYSVATGMIFTNCHSWGTTQTYAWQLDGQTQLVNCVGEGAVNGQVLVRANDCIVDGLFYAAGSSGPGIIVGDTGNAVAGTVLRGKITGCNPSINYANENSASSARMLIYQTTGQAISGTPHSNSVVDLAVDGGATNNSPAYTFQQSMVQAGAYLNNVTGAVSVDAQQFNMAVFVMAGDITFTINNGNAYQLLTLVFVQDSTGSRLATWPANVVFVGGTAPTLSTSGGWRDVLTFYYDGATWFEASRSLGVH